VDRILVVDDNPARRRRLENRLLDQGHRVALAASLTEARESLAKRCIGVVVLRVPLVGIESLDAFSDLHSTDNKLAIILVTASGSTEEAIRATTLGAFDYLLEPFADSELFKVVRQALEARRLTSPPVQLDRGDGSRAQGDALVGRSRPMQEVYKAIGRVAPTDSTVLIRGESGTGKELVARAIYQHSQRAEQPFVVVNCVAIPESLLESELFGYERGAFTGAVSRRMGKIEQAAGGTILLDEVGDMPQSIQAKILRLLQDRSIERLGGQQTIPVDVRILAATHLDLEAAIAKDHFRSDLFYRLNVVPINLPPLRERRDDIALLCSYFMDRITRGLGVRNPGMDIEGQELMAAHDWPGNVRELANAIEQLLIFSRGRRLGVAEVTELLMPPGDGVGHSFDEVESAVRGWVRRSVAFPRPALLTTVVDQVTRQALVEVLELTTGNRTRAAQLLGISRPTLLAKMKKLGLR